MRKSIISAAAMGLMSMMILGAVLPGSAQVASDGTDGKGAAWTPDSDDWTCYRGGPARTGVSPAKATMKVPFYKWNAKTNGPITSCSAIANVATGDKMPEVVVGSNDGRLYCLDGATGRVEWRFASSAMIQSSPAVGDINQDGYAEVVVGSTDGRIYAVDGEKGTQLWKFVTRGPIYYSSPALADLDGDGCLDVVVGSDDGNVYALRGNGTKLWSAALPLNFYGQGIQYSPAVGDLDGDGGNDVAITAGDGTLYALNGKNGTTIWHTMAGETFSTTPVLADLDGDSRIEIAYHSSIYDEANHRTSATVGVLNGEDGSTVWSGMMNSMISLAPVIVADCLGDAKLEIVVQTGFNILCLDGQTGATKWTFDETKVVARASMNAPTAADTDGDGKLEIVTCLWTTTGSLRILNAEDGSVNTLVKLPDPQITDVSVSDGDMDGKCELYFGCNNQKVYCLDYNF